MFYPHVIYHDSSTMKHLVFVLFFFHLDGDESGSVQEVFPAVGHFSMQTITTRVLPTGRKETNRVNTVEDVSRSKI